MTTVNSQTYPLFLSRNNSIVESFDNGETALLHDAVLLGETLSAIGSDSSMPVRPWLLAVKSPAAFAAALIACWRRRVIPMLSADLQPDTLSALLPSIGGILSDDASMTALDCSVVIVDSATTELSAIGETGADEERPVQRTITGEIDALAKLQLPAEGIGLILFTSGSTGEKKQVKKTFRALFEEVKNLEREYGDAVRGLPRRTTVSHFHIYGFLFNILWPLYAGHELASETTFYWEQVLANGENGACIVSSPAHLRFLPNMAQSSGFRFDDSMIFSSGGPLDGAISAEIERETGVCPVEVFGSTETGGIAWRAQKKGEAVSFSPFYGVEVKNNAENGLLIRSPWTGQDNAWIETGDLVELKEDGTFVVKGRYDTVVKIAGKRVSLTEMERMIGGFTGVSAVRVFQATADGQGNRSALAVVIAVGADEPVLEGRKKTARVKEMKQALRRRFDLVTLPRFWRFVAEMPKDSQGKTTLRLLGELLRYDS